MLEALRDKQYMPILSAIPKTIQEALQCPPVQELINNGAQMNDIEACLALEIARIANMLTVGGNIRQGQSLEIAKTLIADFPGESLQDFCLCLRRGIKGAYGDIFRFDILVISEWFKKYLDEKYVVAEEELRREKDNMYETIKTIQLPPALAYKRIDDLPLSFSPVRNKEARKRLWKRSFYAMSQMKGKYIPKISESEIMEEGRQKPKRELYPKTPISMIEQRELHIQWIQENYDPYTGKPLPNWIPESEWLEKQKN